MVGIITYHSAYNFGSALQAFATQTAVKKLGYEISVLNYRLAAQKRFYYPLYRTHYGAKVWLSDMLQFTCQAKRIQRRKQFEKFFSDHLSLTPEFCEPEQINAQWQNYSIMISGSDQIWNKHTYELEYIDWKYMGPYLLKGFTGRKISYASSVGDMTDEDLQRILPELREFSALSCREATSADKIAALLHSNVETVVDPTFLLTRKDWITHLHLKKNDEKYILVYSFTRPKQLLRLLPTFSQLAKDRNCHVKLVTPFACLPCPDRRIEYHPEYGPIEFLEALYNAEAVVTDSYHGTILSVNFGKEFYSICRPGGSEFRKTDILGRLDLQNRVVADPSVIPDLALPPTDYAAVYAKLEELRQYSIDYLKKALKG